MSGKDRCKASEAHSYGCAPSYGTWTFNAEEFHLGFNRWLWIGFGLVAVATCAAVVAPAFWATRTQEHAGDSSLVPLVRILLGIPLFLFVSWVTWRGIAKRWVTWSGEPRRRHRTFCVRVALYEDSVPGKFRGRINGTHKWEGILGLQPGGDHYDLNTPGMAAALQNVLPRLCRLQGAIDGNDGLLSVAASEGGDSETWTFRCRRGPLIQLHFIFVLIVSLITVVAGLFAIGIEINQWTSWIRTDEAAIVLFAIVLASLNCVYLGHILMVPSQLCFMVVTRPGKGDIVDAKWAEYYGFLGGVHSQWAVITDAQGLIKFCEYVTEMRRVMETASIEQQTNLAVADPKTFSPKAMKPKIHPNIHLAWRVKHEA